MNEKQLLNKNLLINLAKDLNFKPSSELFMRKGLYKMDFKCETGHLIKN